MSLFSSELKNHFDNIAKILKEVGERVEGNLVCDIEPDNWVYESNSDKIKNLQLLSEKSDRICEIGVNAGHSLLIMLDKSPNSEYVLFDLGDHKYTRPCVDYIMSCYPNTKIDITYGDSKTTVPEYIIKHPHNLKTFDLIHIDGGHEHLEFTSDFYYTSLLRSSECVFVFDDYDFPNIKKFLDDRLSSNIIRECKRDNLIRTSKQLLYTI